MDKLLIDIEEFERKMNEDVPLLNSEGNPQRFPINDNEILEFYHWTEKNKESLDKQIPEKYRNADWLIKINKLQKIKNEQEAEIKDKQFIDSFRSAAFCVIVLVIILFLLVIYKTIQVFFF